LPNANGGCGVSSGTTVDKLADALAEAILSGEFAPGPRLDEQHLAQRYQCRALPYAKHYVNWPLPA